MSNVKTIPISNADPRLKTFVESFGHKINERRRTTVLTDEAGTWIGYFQLIETPIFVVGFHPELSKGRLAIEAIKKMQAWSEMQYGESLTALNKESGFDQILLKLDFKDINLHLYKSQG